MLSDRQGRVSELWRLGAAGITLAIVAPLATPPAEANPALARMTGHTSSVCHVPAQEPLLNPTGNEFKWCGFSFCKGPPATQAQPLPRPRQPRARPVVASAAQDDEIEEKTALGHNGSTIMMTRKGHQLTMTYSGVRPGLSVQVGSTLFSGTITDRNEIQGSAYTFKRGCPPAPYAVSGVQTNNEIVLRGGAPVRDSSGCAVVDYDDSAPSATLRFDIAE